MRQDRHQLQRAVEPVDVTRSGQACRGVGPGEQRLRAGLVYRIGGELRLQSLGCEMLHLRRLLGRELPLPRAEPETLPPVAPSVVHRADTGWRVLALANDQPEPRAQG